MNAAALDTTTWDSYITFDEYCDYYNLSPKDREKYRPNFESFAKNMSIIQGELPSFGSFSENIQDQELCKDTKAGKFADNRHLDTVFEGAFFCRGADFDTLTKKFLSKPKNINRIFYGNIPNTEVCICNGYVSGVSSRA